MAGLRVQFQRAALYAYDKENYAGAYHAFDMMNQIDAMPFNNAPDTLIIYYTGLAALKAGDNANALKCMRMAAEHGMKEPNIYTYMSTAYMAMGDTLNAGNVLKEGNTKYPDDVLVVIELVNFYLKIGESKQALEYLDIAKKADPSNKTFYFAEGSLYDKMSDFESAKKSYDKALEIDPAYFDAAYNYGVLYYNHAVKLYEIANKEMDNKVYLEKKKVADDELMRALPYMEKAHEINPSDVSTMETLKTLYYRMQMTEKFNAIKKELGQ
jgi:tetratricopeptide (TPR) repeat protein